MPIYAIKYGIFRTNYAIYFCILKAVYSVALFVPAII